jgi:hypothetical protein
MNALDALVEKLSKVENLFTAEPIPLLTEEHDEVLSSITVIEELPAGLGQTPQRLPTPIEVFHFKAKKFKDSAKRKKIVPVKMITAAQGFEMMRKHQFSKEMVPQKDATNEQE